MKKKILCLFFIASLSLISCKKSEEDSSFLFIPTSFSPNYDNLNDVLYVIELGDTNIPDYSEIIDFTFTIYNFDNIQLFQTKNINVGWDGNFNDKQAPTGTYIYIIEAIRANNKENLLKGYISLVR